MDEIEQALVESIWRRDSKYMEGQRCQGTASSKSAATTVLHVNRLIECIHVHASDSRLTEFELAKFFVRRDGSTAVQKRGVLTDRELRKFRRS